MTRHNLRERYPFHVEHKYAVRDRPALPKRQTLDLGWLVLTTIGVTALAAAMAWVAWIVLRYL